MVPGTPAEAILWMALMSVLAALRIGPRDLPGAVRSAIRQVRETVHELRSYSRQQPGNSQ